MSNKKVMEDEVVISSQINWITHKKIPILYVDFRSLYGKIFINKIKHLRIFIQKTDQTDLLVLTDITDAFLNKNIFNEIRQTVKIANPQIKKTAIVGSTYIQNVFIKSLKTNSQIQFKRFTSQNDAINWLIKE